MPYAGIAIIDDDNLFRHIIKVQIAKLKASKDVLLFENGEEAIKYFQKAFLNPKDFTIPKLVFLDINMPIMNGWGFMDEFVKLDKEISQPITIYMVTSSINDEDKQRAASYSEISKYVVKPITSVDLGEILKDYKEELT